MQSMPPRPANSGIAVPVQNAPKILAPNSPNTGHKTCSSCDHWAIRGDDPQQMTRCAAESPKIVTVQVPQVNEQGQVVGMQLQVMSEFPPAPPHWTCGRWERRKTLAAARSLEGLPPIPRS